MSSIKPIVAFVLGGPGAGKGTQCQKIVEVTRIRMLKATFSYISTTVNDTDFYGYSLLNKVSLHMSKKHHVLSHIKRNGVKSLKIGILHNIRTQLIISQP